MCASSREAYYCFWHWYCNSAASCREVMSMYTPSTGLAVVHSVIDCRFLMGRGGLSVSCPDGLAWLQEAATAVMRQAEAVSVSATGCGVSPTQDVGGQQPAQQAQQHCAMHGRQQHVLLVVKALDCSSIRSCLLDNCCLLGLHHVSCCLTLPPCRLQPPARLATGTLSPALFACVSASSTCPPRSPTVNGTRI